MNLTAFARWLYVRLMRLVADKRPPDYVVGADNSDGAYLVRWWVIPRNRVFNIYLHQFLRADDDRALHDHPWWWASFLLDGCYYEHTIAAGGIHHCSARDVGSLKVSGPRRAHRIELSRDIISGGVRNVPCWTLFFTGPVVRPWGFLCAQRGWVPWQDFTADGKPGEVGRGCDA